LISEIRWVLVGRTISRVGFIIDEEVIL